MTNTLQFKLRINENLHSEIVSKANENRRSLNSEIMSRLEASLLSEKPSNTPLTAEQAFHLSKSSVATSKAKLINLITEDINDVTKIGKTECAVLLPFSFYDNGNKVNVDDVTYKKIISPVIDEFTALGYVIYLEPSTSMLNISWGK